MLLCEDRRKGMNIVLKNLSDTELCIWDDVFYIDLWKPGLMILSTTFQYPFYKDEILPMGNLRENRDSSKGHIIIVTKCPIDMQISDKETIIESLNPLANRGFF